MRRSAKKPRSPAADRVTRSLISPEGIDLRLRLGGASERAAAFLIDVSLIVAALFLLTLTAGSLSVASRSLGLGGLLWLAGFFVLRNLYFTLFELRRRAATPGKRALGLRVASRNGGRLTADTVLARNLVRELELFMPLNVVLWGGLTSGWVMLAGLAWSGIFTLFPLFNRDRMRVGDLIAGTWVVQVPRRTLLPDLAGPGQGNGFDFTTAQLGAYGVHELQVLEQVLRSSDPATVAAVAARIRTKIGWAGGEDLPFLQAYYAALRQRLETRLLFGHRRRDKFDAA